jgi:hypothetical protein
MLSLRSLAFILCSAIRRSRALSSAVFHSFPDRIISKHRIIGKKMATNRAAAMFVSYEQFIPSKAIAGWRKGPFVGHPRGVF